MKELLPVPRAVAAVYSRPRLVRTLGIFSRLSSLCVAVIYSATLAITFWQDGIYAARLAAVALAPFVIVTVVRHLIDRPRPYEVYDLSAYTGERVGHREGHSFPSRHVFSAAVIGTSLCFVSLPLGILVLVLGVCMGACRVLLAIHHLSDVICGGLIGIISGVVGMIIINAV